MKEVKEDKCRDIGIISTYVSKIVVVWGLDRKSQKQRSRALGRLKVCRIAQKSKMLALDNINIISPAIRL